MCLTDNTPSIKQASEWTRGMILPLYRPKLYHWLLSPSSKTPQDTRSKVRLTRGILNGGENGIGVSSVVVALCHAKFSFALSIASVIDGCSRVCPSIHEGKGMVMAQRRVQYA